MVGFCIGYSVHMLHVRLHIRLHIWRLALSAASAGIGGVPTIILQTSAAENGALREARRKLRSEMSKQVHLHAGQEFRQHFEGQSNKVAVLSDLETLELRRFGVQVMMAGGVEVCKLMAGVEAVKEAAAAMRRRCALACRAEQQRRAEVMGL
jgi:hypothetical protein